jgi:8-oxo-dGTP diphosphatase
MATMKPSLVVVGAAVLQHGRLLAAQRSQPSHLAGGWELPGGKVEPGETDEQALLREVQEELGVEVRLGARVGGDWPLMPGVVLRVWTAEVVHGVPAPLQDHSELRWLEPDTWYDVPWLAADVAVVTELQRMAAA